MKFSPVMRPSLEIAVDDVNQLSGGVGVESLGVFVRIDQMRADVVLNHFGEETVDRAPASGDQMHDLLAAFFLVERPHNRFDLSANAARPIQEFLLLTNGMAHL